MREKLWVSWPPKHSLPWVHLARPRPNNTIYYLFVFQMFHIDTEHCKHIISNILFITYCRSSGSEDVNRSSDYPYRGLLWFVRRSTVGSFVARKVVERCTSVYCWPSIMANRILLIIICALTINNCAILLLYFGLFRLFFGKF